MLIDLDTNMYFQMLLIRSSLWRIHILHNVNRCIYGCGCPCINTLGLQKFSNCKSCPRISGSDKYKSKKRTCHVTSFLSSIYMVTLDMLCKFGIVISLQPLYVWWAYIQKAEVLEVRTPQIILMFCKVLVWERENYQICWILSGRAIAKMCQRVVNKCQKFLMNIFLVSECPALHKNKPTFL